MASASPLALAPDLPAQLNDTAYASCLTYRGGVTVHALPDLPQTKTRYRLTATDGLLLYLALYAGDRKALLNHTQQAAFERWSPPYWPLEAKLATKLRDADAALITPGFVFGEADALCAASGQYGSNATSPLCGALVAHNVLRALGRNTSYVDSHGVDYLPDWYKADKPGWEAVADKLEPRLMSMQIDGGGCEGRDHVCWGEWYHSFGILAFGLHEAAVLGVRAGSLVSAIAAALNALYARLTGKGHKEDPHEARIDRDVAAVAARFVDAGVLPGFDPALCATRAGYVNSPRL